MEIRKKEQNEPAYPSNSALKIGAAIVAAGILLGSAAGCAGGMGCCADDSDDSGMMQLSGEVAYTPEDDFE